MRPDGAAGVPEAADPLVGQVVAHFRVLAPLGRGGMGVVYRAEDVDLWREVALKVLPPHWAEDGDRRASFLREARSAAAVAHANIATVYEVGSVGARSYIAMEIVRGPTLREELARGLDHRRALALAIGIARGLARAHEVGVLHRDLKPENVMIDRDGEAKILDFGLARALRGEGAPEGGEDPHDGAIVGTLGYMSPEQARGHPLDARSDVFALGIVLFELFTGQRSFASGSAIEMLVAVVDEDAPSLATFGVAPAIAAIVDRCLARAPDARFASAVAVRDALLAARARVVPDGRTAGAELGSAPTVSISAGLGAAARLPELTAGAGAFLGRDHEIADVIARFDAGARLVTLSGPGGIGKTRTAREIAKRLRDRDRRPALAVALGATRSGSDALQAIAGAIGAPLAADVDPVVPLGLALAARGRSLLVLDEAEAVAGELGAPLSRCLESAPETIVLVTSRVRLRASTEELVELGPLDPSLGAELFLERARAARGGMPADAATRAIALEISERLDGTPLAIELAAARAEVLAPAAILDRLDDRLQLLAAASRTDRHASMRAVLEWSWSLLDDVQRSVIARMSAFRGGASADAVEAILGPAAAGVYALDVLQSLHGSSLLRVAADEQGHPRFVMYESVRTYAEQRLRAELPDGRAWSRACGRHAAWFAARARDASASAARGIDASGDRWLARERDNVLACVDRALADDGAELDDGAIAIASLGRALHALGGADAVGARLAALRARAGELAPVAAADVLVTCATLLLDRAPQEARAIAARAVELAAEVRDAELSARASSVLTRALYAIGDHAGAAQVARRALADASATDAPHLRELALADLARPLARAEDTDGSRSAIEAAIASARARGAARALPELELVLGFALTSCDDVHGAAVHERAALEGARAAGLDRIVALASINLGGALHAAGRMDEARELFEQASERFERRGAALPLAVAHANLAFLEHECGALALALSHYDRAIGLLTLISERRYRAVHVAARGAVLAHLDRIEDAERDLAAAEALACTVDERACRVAVSLMRGHLALARARRSHDAAERERAASGVRQTIEAVSTPGPGGAPPATRSDIVRAAVRTLELVMRADRSA